MRIEIEVNESRECFYKIDDFENDFFSDEPFSLQEEAVKHVDETMKAMFKRILNDDI